VRRWDQKEEAFRASFFMPKFYISAILPGFDQTVAGVVVKSQVFLFRVDVARQLTSDINFIAVEQADVSVM
jgi:hypothetical protein